jgi:hypothetical protein
MALVEWGIVARSQSSGVQIRKKLAEPYTDQVAAQTDADAWTAELNTEQKFGLSDWVARIDHVEGGPHSENPNPLDGPAPQQPDAPAVTAATARPTLTATGMSGLPF